MTQLWCWRHPRAQGTSIDGQARCIGRTDLQVDSRRAKRLAHQILRTVRQNGLPRAVWVSPARRCRAVGCVLARLGLHVQVDARLLEMDFGSWDGRAWDHIGAAAVQAWAGDLLNHRPGGGESLAEVAARAREFAKAAELEGDRHRLVVTHGGWINALCQVPAGCSSMPASDWPAPPKTGQLVCWDTALGRRRELLRGRLQHSTIRGTTTA